MPLAVQSAALPSGAPAAAAPVTGPPVALACLTAGKTKLVERDEELASLDRLLADSLAGRGRVALVSGPVTSGKTELLQTFMERSTPSGPLVLSATCARGEHVFPLAVLSQLVLNGALPSDVRRPVTRLLDKAASAISASGAESGTAHLALAQALQGLCLALLELAEDTPLLMTVDDIHLADPASLEGLLYLVRRLRSARVLMVLTENAHLRPGNSPLRVELLRQLHCERITVGPLSRRGIAQLLGERHGHLTAWRLAAPVLAISGGNPLLVRALLEGSSWRSHTGDIVPGPAFGQALLSCLHHCETALLHPARALAVLGSCATPAAIAQLIGADVSVAVRALEAMNAAGLLDDGRFRHPAARAAVLKDLSPEHRRDLHVRAAPMLYDQGAPGEVVARHLLAGSLPARDQWAVPLLRQTARQAMMDNDVELAVDCLRLAHRSCADVADRAAIRAGLAQAEWRTSPSAAARHLGPLCEAMRAGHLGHRDISALIRQLIWHGHVDDAVAALDRMRTAPAGQHVEADAELHGTELWLVCSHPPLARRRHQPAMAAMAAKQQDTLVTLKMAPWTQSASALATVLARGHDSEAISRAEQVLQNARLDDEPPWAPEAALLALMVLIYTDRGDTAGPWCDRLTAEARTHGAVAWQAIFTGARAEIALRQGDLPTALARATSALDMMSPSSWGVNIAQPLSCAILASTRMGRYEEAGSYLARPVPDAMFRTRFGLHYLHARGEHYLAGDRHHAALADFLTCGELMRTWGLDTPGLVPWRTSAAQAWLRLGNRDQARQMVNDQLSRLGTDRSRARGLSLRLLANCSEPRLRPQVLTEAIDILEDRADRYELAHALADLGGAYRLLGKHRRARMMVRRAWHVAKECEAAPLFQELLPDPPDAHRTAQAGSETSRRIAALSDAERRVAALAVAGHTNREIAGKLFITASTVEQHLTRVYRKLDVKHRKDLPASLHPDMEHTP
ncbi:AAA family ATPase [Streptomyces sp. 8N616]|uniref:AAA family ATPase n=1 Tax=Streptomyces sp. 8N616 TaxID=3457414 RepID=UPI003FCF6C12